MRRQPRRAWLGYRVRAMANLGIAMMLYDKPKLAGTLVGVMFAVVLSLQQLSILFGLLDKNTMLVDHAGADIWITHLKPGEIELIMEEVEASTGSLRPRMLQNEQVFEF